MEADILVESFWDGKVRVFRLPDGTEIRRSKGQGSQPFEVVGEFLREERNLTDFRLTFREIETPRRAPRRR